MSEYEMLTQGAAPKDCLLARNIELEAENARLRKILKAALDAHSAAKDLIGSYQELARLDDE